MATSLPENPLFGKYQVLKFLGCGSFAEVYLARNLTNEENVAIKIINKNKLADKTSTSIKREIFIMGKLHHTNIVSLFEVLASKSKIYMVMELVKGGDLYAKISNNNKKWRTLTEDLSRRVFQQLISAVSYCHSRGVYHRDLKLENILVDENGDIKVSDFGLSALSDQIRSDGLLHTFCGTPAYLAPEIILNKGYDGAKIDLWSCGVILFVLNAGYLPFDDDRSGNLMVIYKKICKGEFRYPRWMSYELKRFLSRILDINPMTRVTMDEIKCHPWFKKGLTDVDINDGENLPEKEVGFSFNAFDLISFSPGLDLSGLFIDNFNAADDLERLVVENSAERIMEKIGEKVKEEGDGNVVLRRMKEWSVELQGQNRRFRISLQIYQLTNDLVIVEAKRLAGEGVYFNELWKNKIKPEILIPKENII